MASSAATQTDGSYSLAGLFPTSYLLRFSATGYRTVWYPAPPTEAGAKQVSTTAAAVTSGIDAVIAGLPASIQGSIDPGDTFGQVTATVQVTSLVGNVTKPIATTHTAAGRYRLANLPAPGTYQLSFTAPGYQPTTVVTNVGGGQQRYQPTVLLSVGNGQIGGTVTGGGTAAGRRGHHHHRQRQGRRRGHSHHRQRRQLPDPQPADPADLRHHVQRAGLRIPDLGGAAGSGAEPGRPEHQPDARRGQRERRAHRRWRHRLGGATVTVGGAPSAMTTTTLTTGAVGYFNVNSLPAPGEYTLTFNLAGYAATTVPIRLTADGAPPTVRVSMATALGAITGVITGPDGAAQPGATVTATDGRQNWQVQATGASPGLSNGGFVLANLLPGTYTVTATMPGFGQQTALLTVIAGRTAQPGFPADGDS